MNNKKLTTELNEVLTYAESNFDNTKNTSIVISMIETDKCVARKLLDRKLMESQIDEIKQECDTLSSEYEEWDIVKTAQNFFQKPRKINSLMVLYILLEIDKDIANIFKKFGISSKSIVSDMKAIVKENKPITNDESKLTKTPISNLFEAKFVPTNEIEKHADKNMTYLAELGAIDNFIGDESQINNIFRSLLKKNSNNIFITGDRGCGKTALTEAIAKKIADKKAPLPFKDKIVLRYNISNLLQDNSIGISSVSNKKIQNILDDARRTNGYIIVIEDIELLSNLKLNDNNLDILLNSFIEESSLGFIITSSNTYYTKLLSFNPDLVNKFTRIIVDDYDDETLNLIVTQAKKRYEHYHNVEYDDSAVTKSIELGKRFFNSFKMPQMALELLDEAGANAEMNEKEDEEISMLKEDLEKMTKLLNELRDSPNRDYDAIDEVTKKEIKLKSLLSLAEKNNNVNKTPQKVSSSDIEYIVSEKTKIPLTKLTCDEKTKLKNLNDNIKKDVVGQDEAVDAVCRVVKRQRIGISNPKKPPVLMFAGSTGTGKTYLAKKLAENIFGDEKHLVRMDMSEYADKMSVAKITGSTYGYVGYGDTPPIFEAANKMKQFILLLDECEKADEDVFNILLQVFDEGRLTSGKGETIDLSNCIIIMTSNIGAQEASERGNGIGFNNNDNSDFQKSIFERALKRKFKPEFINRINKIVYFNKLSEKNLKDIIEIEIKKINERIKSMGYSLNEDVYDKLSNLIYDNIKNKSEYGARPIQREIETVIEDRITDLLINEIYEKGYSFKLDDLL